MDIRPGYFVMSMSSVALFAVALFAELGTRHPPKKPPHYHTAKAVIRRLSSLNPKNMLCQHRHVSTKNTASGTRACDRDLLPNRSSCLCTEISQFTILTSMFLFTQ